MATKLNFWLHTTFPHVLIMMELPDGWRIMRRIIISPEMLAWPAVTSRDPPVREGSFVERGVDHKGCWITANGKIGEHIRKGTKSDKEGTERGEMARDKNREPKEKGRKTIEREGRREGRGKREIACSTYFD